MVSWEDEYPIVSNKLVTVWVEDFGENIPIGKNKMFEEVALLQEDILEYCVDKARLRDLITDLEEQNFFYNGSNEGIVFAIDRLKRLVGDEKQ